MSQPLYITGARMIDPATRRDQITDLFVAADGRLQPAPAHVPPDTCRIDGRGLVVAPGLWDLHVHFRDPGNPAAETLASGAAAAATGGFTHVVTMPNTSPACDTPEQVRRQRDPALPVRILPSACVTTARQGAEVADLEALAAAGASAFTDDGAMVADDAVMAAAMRRARALDRMIMDHAVVPALAGPGIIRDCALARRLGLPVFPPEAEVVAVARDIRLSRETGCVVHIQHLSCAGAIEAIRAAQRAGVRVTAEASPHHLAISAEEILADDGNFRMNPPLGTRADVAALRQAVCDGTICCFATDHAPHTPATKTHGFLKAASGVIGLETAVGVTYTVMVERAGLAMPDWVARWTTGPAAVLGLPAPSLTWGAPADLVLLDLHTPWQVDPGALRSRSRNCPFAGWTLSGRAMLTICEGRITHRAV
jgi:dihydroorotase